MSTGTDVEDRVTSFSGLNSSAYGPDGLRTAKTVSGTTTYYITEGGVPIIELNSSGIATAVNTFGIDGLVSRHSGGSSVFYQFDQSGSTTARLNSSGAALDYHGTDAFGLPIATPTTADPYDGFGAQDGYFADHETGLELLGHRFYDPSLGRFVNRDPLGAVGGWNYYRYCENSPLSSADPSGLLARYDPNATLCQNLGYACNDQGDQFFHMAGAPSVEGVVSGVWQTEILLGVGEHMVGGILGSGTAMGDFAGRPGWKRAPAAALDAFSCVTLPFGGGIFGVESEAAETVAIPEIEGIYEFIDANGVKYVGQSNNIARRIAEHLASQKLLPKDLGTVNFTEVLGGKTAREVAEQTRIDQLGGIDVLANKVNPIGLSRWNKLMPYPRR